MLPSSIVFTDELQSYNRLGRIGYTHRRVHHASGVYVTADGASTNTIESFCSLFRRRIDGAHHSISEKWLQNYLDEYTFRWNHRKDPKPMFNLFMWLTRRTRG